MDFQSFQQFIQKMLKTLKLNLIHEIKKTKNVDISLDKQKR